MLDEYLEKTSPVKTAATVKYEKVLIRALKSMIEAEGLQKPKRLKFDDGYRIVRYFKEQTNNKNNSINKYMNYLCRALKHYGIKSDLFDFPKLASDTVHFRKFNDDDLKRIIVHMKDIQESKNSVVYRAMIYLLLDSGVRLAELMRMKFSNVDFHDRVILLEETKSHITRYVPFSEFSESSIRDLMKSGPKRDRLFWNIIADRPLIRDDARNFFKRLSRRLKIESIHAHRFRKTFATKLRENGARLEAIQYLLGHSKLATTMIYVETDLGTTMEEYKKHCSWFK